MPTSASSAPLPVMMVTWSFVAGGSENYALTLAKNLDASRFTPFMCALDQGGPLEAEIEALGIPHFVMHREPGIRLELMWRMLRLFRRHKIKVVHTHHFNQLLYSWPAAKLCGVRLIHTEHSIECYKRPRLRLALRLLALGCHKVLAIGEDGARVLRESVGIAPARLGIIKAGIDIEALQMDATQAREEMGLSAMAPVAAIVARLSPEKNHSMLLRAWATVVSRLPDAVLLMAGAGAEQQKLEAQIEELGLQSNVQLLGVRRDVKRILAASNVFVISSDREGLPIAVLEAMAAARPVVATAVGDLPAVVEEGTRGLTVPAGNSEAMAKALIDLLSNPERAMSLGAAAQTYVGQFGLEVMVAAHQRLYDPAGKGGKS